MELRLRRTNDIFAELTCASVALPLRVMSLLMAARPLIFLAMLVLMLFRPPGFESFPFDRVAFMVLCVAVATHLLATGTAFRPLRPVTLPMAGLLVLSSCHVLCQGYNAESWSMFAAKWLIPFVLFQVAGYMFSTQQSRRAFEIFAVAVFAYLCVISVATLTGTNWLIVPSYILDRDIGIHADRARGPFLQAVANGVTLNLLGLMIVNSVHGRRISKRIAMPLLCTLPLAILATKTRSVWLSFAGSVLLLMFSKSQDLRRACRVFVVASLACVVVIASFSQSAITDRLEDRSPVDFRISMYEAGLEMFREKPLTGWGFNLMREELGRRISDFHQEDFYLHNTYLEVMVEHGTLGLFLYVWIMIDLFRLGRRRLTLPWRGFPDQSFRSIWPLFLGVYFLNASFVGMNYQFVNALLFTIAGLLAAQNRVEDGAVRAH